MRLIGESVLTKAGKKNAPLRKALAEWKLRIEKVEWKSIDDVRVDFPHADGVPFASGTVVTVFNVKGNEYRLLTIVSYALELILIEQVLTHAEYDKNLWKSRY